MASYLEDSNKTITKIRNDIVCQVCESRPRPGKTQWYRCLKLHQICQDCRGKNEYCSCGKLIEISGLCFDQTMQYCKMTEDLLNVKGMKFQISCKHKKNGCQETFSESELDHEDECIFRVVPCPWNAIIVSVKCEAKVTFQNVIQHFKESHAKMKSMDNGERHFLQFGENGNRRNGVNCYEYPQKLEINGTTFMMFGKLMDKIFYRWVYIVGSPKEAKHFSFTFKLFGQNDSVTSVNYGKVAAIDESFETLMKAGKCFTFAHQSFMAQFVDENLKHEYSLEIRNLKEEAKDANYESGISDDDAEDSKDE